MPYYPPQNANVNVSAGTTSNNLGSVVFSNSNGVSFGLNGSTVTASAVGGGGGSVNFSAGTTSSGLASVVFSNSNGVSFGLNNGTITGTVQTNYLTTAMASNRGSDFVQANAAFAGTSASGTIASNGISVSIGPYITTQSNQAFSADAMSNFQTLIFQDSNGVSFSNNAGSLRVTHGLQHTSATSAITSAALHTSASRVFNAVAATNNTGGGTASLSSNVSFSNANGLTFYTSAGNAIVGSYTVPNVPAQTNQQMTMFATGNTTLSSTGTSNASSLIFRGSGAASVGITNGSVLIDVAAGAAAITQSFGMSTQTAGGATAGTTGYATGDDVLYHFVPGSNITMSQSINGASGTLSIYGPAAGGGVTLSGFDGFANNEFMTIAGGQASLWIDRFDLPCALQFDRVGLRITHSNATNSSGSATISVWIGFSTRNASTLSSLHSTSFTTGITQSGTVGSYSNYGGIKILPVPWTTTITGGNYWVGIVSRTTTGGANMTFGNLANSQLNSTMSGYFGSGSNATNGIRLGVGVYSATTAGLPAAISLTQINGNSSAFLRQPAYLFMSNII